MINVWPKVDTSKYWIRLHITFCEKYVRAWFLSLKIWFPSIHFCKLHILQSFSPHCSNGTKQSYNSSWAPKRQIFKCLKNPGMRIFYDWEIMLEKSYTPYVVLAFCKPDPPMREHQHCSVLHLRSNYPDSSGTCTQRTPEIGQRYTYRVLQTIQMKLILLCVWAEPAVLGSTKIALRFKYEI